MVGLLLERGASANLQSKNGLTALHLAAQDDRTPIARLLTRYGANIDPQTKVSFRPDLIDRLINQLLNCSAGGFLFSDCTPVRDHTGFLKVCKHDILQTARNEFHQIYN